MESGSDNDDGCLLLNLFKGTDNFLRTYFVDPVEQYILVPVYNHVVSPLGDLAQPHIEHFLNEWYVTGGGRNHLLNSKGRDPQSRIDNNIYSDISKNLGDELAACAVGKGIQIGTNIIGKGGKSAGGKKRNCCNDRNILKNAEDGLRRENEVLSNLQQGPGEILSHRTIYGTDGKRAIDSDGKGKVLDL